MRVTAQSDYALRVLIYVGLRGEEASQVAEIANCFRISKSHLTKVVWRLSQAGFLDTSRGRGEGIRLAMAPDEVNLGAVLRAVEGFSQVVECFGQDSACIITPACAARRMFREAHDAFFAVFDQYTLSDLLDRRTGLSEALKLTA